MVAKIIAHCRDIKEQILGPGFHSIPKCKRFFLTWVRMCWVVLKGFKTDLLTLRAASLTYVTLISIVPFLAIFFSLVKAFGADKIDRIIAEPMSALPPQIAEFAGQIIKSVQKVDAGTMGALGLVITMFSAMKLLTNIEMSFNNIWGTKAHRTFMDKCVYYSATCFFGSILVIISFSMTTFLNSENFKNLVTEYLSPFDGMIFWLMSLSGVFSVIIAFSLLYIWMPNVKVRIPSALVGGITGGICWKIVQVCYIKLQVGVAKGNGVEGSFAAIPLFLGWLYLSWLIVLFGAEVAFAYQHWRTYDLEGPGRNESFLTRMTLGVIVTLEVAKDFVAGSLGWCPEEFAKEKMISRRLVEGVITQLTESGILRKVEGKDNYLPGKSIDLLNLSEIENAFRGSESPTVEKCEDHSKLALALKSYHQCLDNHHENLSKLTVRELITEN